MAGTMAGVSDRRIAIPTELYNRLSNMPTKVVQRFYDLNLSKYTFLKAISPFRTKTEMNIRTAGQVLEERAN